MQKNSDKGFSLIEMLMAMTFTIIIMSAIVLLLISTQRASLTESMKQEMNQESRALQQVLSESFKSSGAILSILNIPSLLGSTPVFNGVYPFNNNNYADGVILASADPNVVTRTTDVFNSGGGSLSVITTQLLGTATNAWVANDLGMLIRPDGYYVFKVAAVTDSLTLSVSTVPAYYSGLIKPAGTYNHYNDDCALGSDSYPGGSIVVRLDYFYILLARDEADGTRSLTLTTDTTGDANFLSNSNLAVPVVFNIEDIQFSYILKDGTVVNPADNSIFLNKSVASVRICILYKTEQQKHKGSGTKGLVYAKPAMGDRAATKLAAGLFNYVYNEYEIYIRNYNTLY